MTSGGYDPSNHPQAGQPYRQPPQYNQPGQYAPPPEPYAPQAGQYLPAQPGPYDAQPGQYAPPAQPYAHQPPPAPEQPYGHRPPPAPPTPEQLPYQQTIHPQPQYGGQQYGHHQPAFGVPGKLWPRFAARVIDTLIVVLPLGILLNFVLVPNLAGFGGVALSYALIFAATLVYYVLMEMKTGATLGKKILGLKVVAPNGAPTVPPLASLKRNAYLAVSIIPCLGWVAGVALTIYMGATLDKDPNKQGWHDKLAGGTHVLVA